MCTHPNRPRYGPLVACASAVVASASADIIHMKHAGHASGTLAGVPFPDSAFEIQAQADTDDLKISPGLYELPHTSASISIKGLGTFDFITPTQSFVNNNNMIVGFSTLSWDLFDGPIDEALATWDMQSGIGPIAGDGFVIQWLITDVVTSGGVLVLDDGLCSVVFEAQVFRCSADLNADGVLDLFDFLSFTNLFNSQDPDADCTADGMFDLFDFLCFVNSFNQGC